MDRAGQVGRGFDPWPGLDWLASQRDRVAAPTLPTSEFPLVNISTNADEAILTTEIPGMDLASVEISVAGKTVVFGAAARRNQKKRRTRTTGRSGGRGSSARPSSCLLISKPTQWRPRSAKAS